MSEVVVTRRISASPSIVYSYLTDPVKWAEWQGTRAEIEPMPGGLFSMIMPNGLNAQGRFVELTANRRIVFTWGWLGHETLPPGASTVTIELERIGPEETQLTLVHGGLPDDELDIHTLGWNHYVPRLASVAEGRGVGPDPGPG